MSALTSAWARRALGGRTGDTLGATVALAELAACAALLAAYGQGSRPATMRIGVPKETAAGERRVALVPEVVRKLKGKDHEIVVESGAGAGALLADEQFTEAGATIGDPWGADVVVKVAPPSAEEVAKLGSGGTLIGFLEPLTNPEGVQALANAGVTAIAMEAIPRISRAQSMDALSSQANIGGYRSVLAGRHAVAALLSDAR